MQKSSAKNEFQGKCIHHRTRGLYLAVGMGNGGKNERDIGLYQYSAVDVVRIKLRVEEFSKPIAVESVPASNEIFFTWWYLGVIDSKPFIC